MDDKDMIIKSARENAQKAPQPNLAVNLRRLRKYVDLTQSEMASILFIDRTTYAYYEIGRSLPRTDTLIRIACAFHISVDALLGIRELPPAYREEDKWKAIAML